MKLKEAPVRYVNKAELEAFKEEEHRQRVELHRRVERGDLTPEEANREAFWFKGRVPGVAESPINFTDILSKAATLRFPKRSNGRARKKTIRS